MAGNIRSKPYIETSFFKKWDENNSKQKFVHMSNSSKLSENYLYSKLYSYRSENAFQQRLFLRKAATGGRFFVKFFRHLHECELVDSHVNNWQERDVRESGASYQHMGVSKNGGTPKSSILIGFSIINHPFWGTFIFGNTHIFQVHLFSICLSVFFL